MPLNIAEIPVFILCGGLGTPLKEMTEFRPKPMVAIGPDPILLHIMKHNSGFGFRRFVLCMGWSESRAWDAFVEYYLKK
jgi:glucose-1-phosphate cytidylyltransferase